MLLKAHDETRRAPDPAASVEMAIIRLAYAADLPGPEEALKALASGTALPSPPASPSGGGGGGGNGGGLRAASGGGASLNVQTAPQAMTMAAPAAAPGPTLATFEDVLGLIEAKRDMLMLTDVRRFVRPVSLKANNQGGGVIAFSLVTGAPPGLSHRLSQRLKEWTGRPWMMDVREPAGEENAWERARREKADYEAEVKADPFVLALLAAFPGAEVTVKAPPIIAPAPPISAEGDDDHIGDVMPDDDAPSDEGGFDQLDEDDVR